MSANLRLPNITAQDPSGKVQQLQRYVYQLVEELNWALAAADQRAGEVAAAQIAAGAAAAGGVSSGKSPAETFASIKSLIIKSADIVDAYYQVINKKLEGLYVAQSEFGTFAEKTTQDITANSTNISQSFTNIQAVDEKLSDGLNATSNNLLQVQNDLNDANANMNRIEKIVVGVNAYINSGKLYDDQYGIPVYGIEVGQRTEINGVEYFNKYARFTSNKLSFYDANDNEVAYVSDRMLYITDVYVIGSFRIGQLVTTVQSDGSLVRKYVR